MNCARNCENLLNFVKVIPKILLVPFFSGHGVYSGSTGGTKAKSLLVKKVLKISQGSVFK